MFDCSVLTACLLSVRFGDDGGGDELPSVDHGPLNEGPWEKDILVFDNTGCFFEID